MTKSVFQSVCPLDCPDTCAVEISVEDKQVVKLGGAQHPVTRGFACVKMNKFPEKQEHPDRLLYPQKRVGSKGEGRFERIQWDEALDGIAQQLQENTSLHGEQSLLPYSYSGTMGLIERDFPLAFFRALGGAELDWTICASTGGAGWEANYGGEKLSTDPEDIEHARLIILWGINVARSNSHLLPFIKAAKKNGAVVVQIDPYRNETSKTADEVIQLAVGTDAALALCIGNAILQRGCEDAEYLAAQATGLDEYRQSAAEWTIDRTAEFCQVPKLQIESLIDQLCSIKPAFTKIGYGMTRNEGGGNAMRAISLLPALLGSWKHRGGGAALSTSGAFGLNTSRYSGKHLIKPERRHINQNLLGSALASEEPLISSLFIFNSNPAAVAPNSALVRHGLRRSDLFTVVIEHFQTDSADYADYLLPATTFVEHPDIYTAYGHYHLQWAEPIVEARGECRPNSWIFKQLAERMGITDEIFSMSTEELAAELLSSDHPRLAGVTFEALKQQRSMKINLGDGLRPYSDGSHFPDKKIRFGASVDEGRTIPAPHQVAFEEMPTDEFPLRLISPPGPYIINTSLGNLESLVKAAGGEPTVVIHPSDAQNAGLSESGDIHITSSTGTIRRKAIVSEDAKQGVVVARGQWWPKLAPDKKSLNDITTERLTDLGGGSTFGNVLVRIEAAR
jgi:anaerobic selenocysteine-containing dehydrogenase